MRKLSAFIMCAVLCVLALSFAGCGDDDPIFFFPVKIKIAPATLPDGTVGVAYSQTLTATRGTPPYTWSITAGTLPAGLALDTATGIISGTPTTAGASNFTVSVSDSATTPRTASLAYTIIIQPATALTITTTSLPAVTVGTPYSQTLAATGGVLPLAWSITAGTLPVGLALDPATGIISGTPTTVGTANFTVTVTDSSVPAATDTQDLSITVSAAGGAVTITTTTLPAATVGTLYSQTLAATGGVLPLAWSITAGTLPAGLALDPATGIISGTPTTTETANFTVTVTDSSVPALTDTQDLSITVNPAGSTLQITTQSMPSGTFGVPYTRTLGAIGGTQPYIWSISAGTLPSGLSLSGAVISGVPLVTGTFNFTVMVTDSAVPANTATVNMTVIIEISAAVQAGKTIYDNQCAGCHSLGIYDTTGSPDLGTMTLANFEAAFGVGGGGTHQGQTLNATQFTDIITFTSLF